MVNIIEDEEGEEREERKLKHGIRIAPDEDTNGTRRKERHHDEIYSDNILDFDLQGDFKDIMFGKKGKRNKDFEFGFGY